MNKKILTPQEALIALAEGKKLQKSEWRKTAYILLTDGAMTTTDFGTYETNTFNGFSIFEEPKPKKKYWLWDVDHDGMIKLFNTYLDDDGMTTNGFKELLPRIEKHEHLFIEV